MEKEPNYLFPFLWMRDQSEDILRREIEKIYDCGIRSVCLESRPHPDFGGPGWWRDFDIVVDEAKKRGMTIWILDDAHFPTGQANGMLPEKHPELARKYLMMQHTDCVGPIPQVTLDVNLMMTKRFTWLDFGKKIEKPLIDEQKLVSVVATRIVEGDTLEAEVLDLTDRVKDGTLYWDVPAGVWRICVCFTTYDFGSRNEYINYVDKDSVRVLLDAIYEPHYERYKDLFGNVIAGFFSDEPGYYSVEGFDMDDKIGRKKMALPWCDELEALMQSESGAGWKTLVPFLWMPCGDTAVSAEFRRAYMDRVTRLYAKNFCGQVGAWCKEHGVEYIGHVIEDNGEHARLGSGTGHFFRGMSGQHMSGIDTIGGQILPGSKNAARHGPAYIADGVFNHFGLVKMGASAAQIDPKKKGRLMCEAFGAYGWNFGVRSMKWLVDFLLVQGVNHLVPHAFSMAPYPDTDCPPHFYAGGNNGEYPYFAEVMKYANRMCSLLNGGVNVPVAGVLYHAENEWMNDCMQFQVPAQKLLEHQIDVEIVPEDVFTDRAYYGTVLKDGKLVVNGRELSVLVVPASPMIDGTLTAFTTEAQKAGFPVWFVDEAPTTVVGTGVTQEMRDAVKAAPVVELDDLATEMGTHGFYDILVEKESIPLLYYHYRKGGREVYVLFNTSLSETVETAVTFPYDTSVWGYDGMVNGAYPVQAERKNGKTVVTVSLAPYETSVLVFGEKDLDVGACEPPVNAKCTEGLQELDVSTGWTLRRAKAIDYPVFGEAEELLELVPVSSFAPDFAGIMRYERTFELCTGAGNASRTGAATSTETASGAGKKAYFAPEHIFEVAEVFVNGTSAGKRVAPPYLWDISALCKDGVNALAVEVANTPTRDTLSAPTPTPFGPEREILEPSGMFGKIVVAYSGK